MKENEMIRPVLDMQRVQELANEAAMKGVQKGLEEYFYTWNSPFQVAIKSKIEESLSNLNGFKLPNILGVLNNEIAGQMEKVANTCIGQTIIPYLNDMLVGQVPEVVKVTDLVKWFVFEHDEFHDNTCSAEMTQRNGIYDLHLECSTDDTSMDIAFYTPIGCTNPQILISPITSKSHYSRGKVTVTVPMDNGKEARIEYPSVCNVLESNFLRQIFKLMLVGKEVIIDRQSFDDILRGETINNDEEYD